MRQALLGNILFQKMGLSYTKPVDPTLAARVAQLIPSSLPSSTSSSTSSVKPSSDKQTPVMGAKGSVPPVGSYAGEGLVRMGSATGLRPVGPAFNRFKASATLPTQAVVGSVPQALLSTPLNSGAKGKHEFCRQSYKRC